MRQRAMIAMALLFTPDLVIMDEPTSALDVVAQRSLMVQIKQLQRELGFAVIFVTHDMSLVSHFSDQLLVMYAGQVAEIGSDPHGVRHAGPPVQQGPARRVPLDPRAEGAADRHPRQPTRPRAPADRLPVPPALPRWRWTAAAPSSPSSTRSPTRRPAACGTRPTRALRTGHRAPVEPRQAATG